MTAGAQQGAQQSSSVATLDDRNEHQAGLAPQQSAASPKEQVQLHVLTLFAWFDLGHVLVLLTTIEADPLTTSANTPLR